MSSRRGAAACAVLAAVLPGSPAEADPPRCLAEVELAPARAVVGQQVVYRVRIFSADDVTSVEWSHPPAFPGMRTENLPGDPQPGDADAGDLRVRDERRALFAERPGEHALRAPELRCTSADGALTIAAVPEATLRVDPLPEAGRPQGFAGLVGPLGLFVTVTPRELRLGESARVAMMARGRGNLWALRRPFAPDAFGSAEVFEHRPELVLERGRSLLVRRHFALDVVPREPGVLEVPPLALPFFDPATRSYRVARSEAVQLSVSPRAETGGAAGSQTRKRASGKDALEADAGSRSWSLGWLAVLPLLALAALFRRRGRGRPARAALAEAEALEAAGDRDELAAALARALREALVPHVEDARAVAPEELTSRRRLPPAVSAAAHLLASVERARFDPDAPPPDPAAVRRAIAEL